MITIRCPKCGRTMEVARDATDPANAAVVETECDRHDSGFETVHYFDASGKEISLADERQNVLGVGAVAAPDDRSVLPVTVPFMTEYIRSSLHRVRGLAALSHYTVEDARKTLDLIYAEAGRAIQHGNDEERARQLVDNAKSAIPQPGETWQHEHLGSVKVVKRWNDKECVCEGTRPGVGTRILCDCFLTRRATEQNNQTEERR